MILLAGVLIVLAYFLYSTESVLLNSLGQEAGREASNAMLSDYDSIRSTLATSLEYEMRDSSGVVMCPTDEADFRGKVQSILVLIAKIESNRGQIFEGDFLDLVVAGGEAETTISLYLTDGRSVVAETLTYVTQCT